MLSYCYLISVVNSDAQRLASDLLCAFIHGEGSRVVFNYLTQLIMRALSISVLCMSHACVHPIPLEAAFRAAAQARVITRICTVCMHPCTGTV